MKKQTTEPEQAKAVGTPQTADTELLDRSEATVLMNDGTHENVCKEVIKSSRLDLKWKETNFQKWKLQ